MKTITYFLFFILGIIMLPGCKEERIPDSEHMQKIITAATAKIDEVILPVFANGDAIYNQTVQDNLKIRLMVIEGVLNVNIYNNVVAVKFINQTDRFWGQKIEYNFGDLDSLDLLYNYGKTNSGKKCLIINQFNVRHNTPWPGLIFNTISPNEVVSKLRWLLFINGWETTVVEGQDVNLDFYRNGLSGYDMVFWMSHGVASFPIGEDCTNKGAVFIASNQLETANKTQLEHEEINSHMVSYLTVDGKTVACISKKFIEAYYNESEKPFKNTFFYLVACNGFTIDNFYRTLSKEGACGIAGWEGENKQGPRTGYLLLKNMLKGHSMGSAFETLAAADKEDYCKEDGLNNHCGAPCYDYAKLNIYPRDESRYSVYLGQKDVTIFNLSNPRVTWNYPLNDCYMNEISDYGSSNTFEISYNENQFNENSNFKVEILSVFENGKRKIITGYADENWVSVDKNNNTISLDLCTRFGSTTYVEQTIIISYDNYKSNSMKFKVDKPSGAYKTESGEPLQKTGR